MSPDLEHFLKSLIHKGVTKNDIVFNMAKTSLAFLNEPDLFAERNATIETRLLELTELYTDVNITDVLDFSSRSSSRIVQCLGEGQCCFSCL